MAAVALLKIHQGATVGADGEALVVALGGGPLVFANADNTGVADWYFELCYVPPGSAIVLFHQGPGPLATFTVPAPDVPGSYRVRLVVRDAGLVPDTDIRVATVPFANGTIAPPYQGVPQQCPLVGAGAKPNEMNFLGQLNGWDGNTTTPGMLYDRLKALDFFTGGSLVNGALPYCIAPPAVTAARMNWTSNILVQNGASSGDCLAIGDGNPAVAGDLRLLHTFAINSYVSGVASCNVISRNATGNLLVGDYAETPTTYVLSTNGLYLAATFGATQYARLQSSSLLFRSNGATSVNLTANTASAGKGVGVYVVCGLGSGAGSAGGDFYAQAGGPGSAAGAAGDVVLQTSHNAAASASGNVHVQIGQGGVSGGNASGAFTVDWYKTATWKTGLRLFYGDVSPAPNYVELLLGANDAVAGTAFVYIRTPGGVATGLGVATGQDLIITPGGGRQDSATGHGKSGDLYLTTVGASGGDGVCDLDGPNVYISSGNATMGGGGGITHGGNVIVQPGASNMEGWIWLRNNLGNTVQLIGTAAGAAAVGWFGTAPVVKQTLAGAKAGNTALASVCSLLVAYGLAIDTTT